MEVPFRFFLLCCLSVACGAFRSPMHHSPRFTRHTHTSIRLAAPPETKEEKQDLALPGSDLALYGVASVAVGNFVANLDIPSYPLLLIPAAVLLADQLGGSATTKTAETKPQESENKPAVKRDIIVAKKAPAQSRAVVPAEPVAAVSNSVGPRPAKRLLVMSTSVVVATAIAFCLRIPSVQLSLLAAGRATRTAGLLLASSTAVTAGSVAVSAQSAVLTTAGTVAAAAAAFATNAPASVSTAISKSAQLTAAVAAAISAAIMTACSATAAWTAGVLVPACQSAASATAAAIAAACGAAAAWMAGVLVPACQSVYTAAFGNAKLTVTALVKYIRVLACI